MYGLQIYNELKGKGIHIINFYDNDISKHNTKFMGVEILSPDLLIKNNPFLILATTWEKEVINQLQEMCFNNYISISHYGIKDLYDEWIINKQLSNHGFEFFQENEKNISKWNVPKLIRNSNERWAIILNEIYNNKVSFPASLSPAAGELYRSLILNIAPKIIVEIGIFMGASTIWSGSAILDLEINSKIHSIDLFSNNSIDKNHYAFVENKIESAGLSNIVELHKLNSYVDFEEFVPHLENQKIDFLFIDGDHEPRGVTLDFLNFTKYLSIGGYILFHDVFPEYCGWEGPAFVIDKYIKDSDSFELCQIYTTPNNYGLALVRKIK